MHLNLPVEHLQRYKSPAQRARVSTEAWAAANLFCPNCDSPRLEAAAANTPALDYVCPRCEAPFQLKSQSRPFSSRITDAAYDTMCRAIREDRTPNLFALHYELLAWRVQDLVLVPWFAFSLSVLEKRKPLGPRARRAGWVGCNFLLANIPFDARIPVVLDSIPISPAEVRRRYAWLRPLAGLSVEKRGWTLDVLNLIRSLRKMDFTLSELYGREADLARLHPANRHVRDKIRQQLQVLRDLGYLEFHGGGSYSLL